MTSYFSLTRTNEPTQEALAAAWRRVGTEVQQSVEQAQITRPVFFTELGYASQNGINKDPWNYFIAPKEIDVREQRMCFEAALAVLPSLDWLYGAFWFEYFGEGGRGDPSYSPRGKPAMEVWSRWSGISAPRTLRRAVQGR